jgi:hypothetical protein
MNITSNSLNGDGLCNKKENKSSYTRRVRMMTRIIKQDVAPGEFKCITCYAMWSSYMENHILCTDTIERYGLHNFDFRNPII